MAPFLLKLEKVNKAYMALGVPKLTKRQAEKSSSVFDKIAKMRQKVCSLLNVDEPPTSIGDKMLEQLVRVFNDKSKDDQYRILTSLPIEESRESLQIRFGVSENTAKPAKTLQEEKGIFSTPSPKVGMRISEDTMAL